MAKNDRCMRIRMVLDVCNKWRKRLDFSAIPVLSCLMYAARQVDNVQNHDDGLQAPAIVRHDIDHWVLLCRRTL